MKKKLKQTAWDLTLKEKADVLKWRDTRQRVWHVLIELGEIMKEQEKKEKEFGEALYLRLGLPRITLIEIDVGNGKARLREEVPDLPG